MNIIDKRASNPAAALNGTELVYVAQLGADAVTTVSDMQTFITNGFLLITTAASTYQTLSGMSSYLTTAAAASTYQTQAGMSSYLTTANAASTYQTTSGMSSYLTIANSRYQFVTDPNPTYTVPASAVTANGNTIIELSNNSLTSITINAATGTGKVAGDSVNISITGTYAAQVLEASGVTLQGDLTFSYQYETKTLVYKGSNVWKVVG